MNLRDEFSDSILMRHLFTRIGSRVKVFMHKQDMVIEGKIVSIDYPRMWMEIEAMNGESSYNKKTWFINLHKVNSMQTMGTEEETP